MDGISSPDETMNTAMDAFAALDEQPQPPADPNEENDDADEKPLDSDSDGEDDSREDGDEPSGDDQEDEPETPAIEPPARLSAEKKTAFAKLPTEAQRFIAAEMGEQERAIGLKAQEAAAARKHAEAVTTETTNVHRQFAEQLDTYAQAIMPQRPDHGLIATDPQAYAYHLAQYEAASAQLGQLQQHAANARQQAHMIEQAQEAQAARDEYARIVEAFPEWETSDGQRKIAEELVPIGKLLGYDDQLMQQAGATDLKALKVVSGLKAKADKWDALQASKMANVRSAKQQPKVSTPGTAQPKGSARAQGLQDSMNRLRQSGDVRDAAKAFARLG